LNQIVMRRSPPAVRQQDEQRPTAGLMVTAPIKGNASSLIYHLPGQPSYAKTIAEVCFASEEEAQAAGYRARRS
jgi:hypothetical protein